ncbi:VOC family protein [Amycolatopsis sp. NPDC005232]|uniref:VOC family protein n=1 Tax=Amycolatopsis sp. NPDC005232 TaxID=3157027 RepID=UPI0033B4AD67
MTFVSGYHVGIVVPKLDDAAAELGELLGLSWATPRRATLRVEQGGDLSDVDLLYTYSRPSRDGLMVELIEEIPGTLWTTEPGRSATLHHIGFWADQFPLALSSLDAGGKREVSHVNSAGETRVFSYHHVLGGALRVELVDSDLRADVARWVDRAPKR